MAGELKAGRYEVEKELGSGGMGVVYRARDTRLNRIVALKTVKPEHLHDVQFRRRLAQEARAASAISHPGIATVYDFVEDGEQRLIVHEYVEGVSLRARMHERGFTTEEVLIIGIQISEALAAAHEHGVIHRDIKPENVMLSPAAGGPGRIKVLDFGLAKMRQPLSSAEEGHGSMARTGSITSTGMVIIGTVNYMSPEQLAAEPVDARTDLYALGLMLYEMATGVNPFLGETPTSTIANILTREPPPVAARNPVAPLELDRIIRKCLRKRKEERYQSARDLLVDLSNLRRDLARREEGQPDVSKPVEPQVPLTIPRGFARALFLLIQVGYLAMYIALARYLPDHVDRMAVFSPHGGILQWPIAAFVALCGAALRFYLLAAVGFDYSDSGRLFRPLFPAVLLLDELWAITPLLLYSELHELVWVFVVGLAFLPFTQRSLLFSAYGPRGGRTSGVKVASSL